MYIPVEKILDFYEKRTCAHIKSVNYFAGLIGYHFPEHDNDKMTGTIRTGYAHITYAKYHPEFTVTQTQRELYTLVPWHRMHTCSYPARNLHIFLQPRKYLGGCLILFVFCISFFPPRFLLLLNCLVFYIIFLAKVNFF